MVVVVVSAMITEKYDYLGTVVVHGCMAAWLHGADYG